MDGIVFPLPLHPTTTGGKSGANTYSIIPRIRSLLHSLLLIFLEIYFCHRDDVLHVDLMIQHVDRVDLSHRACQKMC